MVAITGASGAIYGARLVEVLSGMADVETHLVVSRGAKATLAYETHYDLEQLSGLVGRVYDESDVGAGPASGTFLHDGMIVAPCSIKTLSQIAAGISDTLTTRAADVCLKERRRLVLVVRETPLHLGHLRAMTAVTEAGAVVLPPVPGFYVKPKTIEELVDHTITKILDQFGVDAGLITRWSGID